MIPTHALAINGTTWMDLQEVGKGELDDLDRFLHRLDGNKLYSLILWKMPAGKHLDEVDPDTDAEEYIQCAGSADRMTVEVRRKNGAAS